MISYEDFLSLKKEKLKLESDNLRLRNEIIQLTEIKEQILPMKTNLIEKYQVQEKEKDAKIMSLESNISILRNQINKNTNEVNEKNNHLLQQNQKLKEEICSLKTQYKQKEDEFSQKCKQDTNEINNLKSLLSKLIQQNSPTNNNDTIIKTNNQLNITVQILTQKYKTLKNRSNIKILELTQQNKEKDLEIQSLKEEVDQIKCKFQYLPQNKEEEMNNQYKNLFIQSQDLLNMKDSKIKSLNDEISKLKSDKLQCDSNNLDEYSKLNHQIQELKQKNKENEIKIKDLQTYFIQSNDDIKQLLLQYKQKANELNCEKKENEEKTKSLEKSILELNNAISKSDINCQVNQLNYQNKDIKDENILNKSNNNKTNINSLQENKYMKDENVTLKNKNKANINSIQQSKDMKEENIKNKCNNSKANTNSIQDNDFNDQNQKNDKTIQQNQNLSKKSKKINSNKYQIKKLEGAIKKLNHDIENKEKLINKLKLIINMNQDKINRLETENIGLNKQLEIYHQNNERIFDFIQSYKKQNLELIKITFDNIQKSNHSLKNEICKILLNLSEKIEDNEKKNNFIDELRAEISIYNKLAESSQNNEIIENQKGCYENSKQNEEK